MEKKVFFVICLDCPWCWFSHEEFAVLSAKDPVFREKFTLEWRFFILQEDIPDQGMFFDDDPTLMAYANSDILRNSAETLGLTWHRRVARFNVARASLLGILVRQRLAQDDVERFVSEGFRRYFTADTLEGRNLYEPDNLKAILENAHIDLSLLDEVLSGKHDHLLEEEMRFAAQRGIMGVPTFSCEGYQKSGYARGIARNFLLRLTQ